MTVSPDQFLNDLLGFLKTSALKAAIELNLFSAIAAEKGDLGRIANRTGASERGIRILCDYLTVHGFLEKQGGRWRLTPSTETFLTRESPAYMGTVADFLASPEMIGLWLTDSASFVRKGGSLGLISEAPDSPIWVKFARAMIPFVTPLCRADFRRGRGVAAPAAPRAGYCRWTRDLRSQIGPGNSGPGGDRYRLAESARGGEGERICCGRCLALSGHSGKRFRGRVGGWL